MVIDSPKIDQVYEETPGRGTTFNHKVTVLPATLQLTLGGAGGGFDTTITAPAPAAARTYTILDAGAAANFVMSSGSGLTSGRLALVGAGGLLVDSSGIQYSGSFLIQSSGAYHAISLGVPGAPTGVVSAGGTLADGGYYYVVTAGDAGGVYTSAGAESSVQTIAGGAGGTVTLTWAAVQGAFSYRIYRTTSSGVYGANSLIAITSNGVTSLLDNGLAYLSGQPPASNVAYATKLYSTGPSYLGSDLIIRSYSSASSNGGLVVQNQIAHTSNYNALNVAPILLVNTSAAIKNTFAIRPAVAAGVAVTNGLRHISMQTLSMGAGASVDVQYGLHIDNWSSGATANYPIYFVSTGASNSINWGTTCSLYAGNTTTLTASASFQILATTNQLQLGTTLSGAKAITVTAPAPAASRTYTMLDAGADANFVMSEGTATINGAKTFGNDTTHSANIIGASTTVVYLGAAGTDGSWSMSRSGNNLIFQRRESGVWVTKGTITA